MSSPRKSTPQRAVAKVNSIPWAPEHRELFKLAGDDWTPPSAIKVSFGHGRSNWRAVFVMPCGQAVELLTHCDHSGGCVVIAEASLTMKFEVKR